MAERRSNLFFHLNSRPSPHTNPTLWQHRLEQRRPFSRNPFEEDVPSGEYGNTIIDPHPTIQNEPTKFDDIQTGNSHEEIVKEKKNYDVERGEQIPPWLNLFFDLAWTATFSSLTSNNKFKDLWDSVSYVAFFITAWWLWVSQVSYNIDFYTDDWFHLLFVFLQLLIFGALAATTHGYDVTNYIRHSPGSLELESYDIMTSSPDGYAAEHLAKLSLRGITFVVALSRILLLIQHIRVIIYAVLTPKAGRFPRRLLIVPASLVVSAGLFFAAFATTLSDWGRTPNGAKVKYACWGSAVLVEMIAQVIRFQLDVDQGIKLRSHGSVTGRLSDITTILLGEGINAIAGTFYAIEQAPGFSAPTGSSVVCCAIIVFFLAYLYFEGAAPLKPVRRRAAWIMMHLPWLLSVILLLEGKSGFGVKNQLLLSSFLRSAVHLSSMMDNGMNTDDLAKLNATMRPLLLKAGLSFDQEYARLIDMMESNFSSYESLLDETSGAFSEEITWVWYTRMQLSATLNTYLTFMDNETISETLHLTIGKYQNDYNYTLEDIKVSMATGHPEFSHYIQILEELCKPSVENARYIMAMCGATLIFLASLNLIQAWPRDRFHWASIFSRYATSGCMVLLLLLNLGSGQLWVLDDTQLNHRAAVFKWIDA
ncbi:hypothetical protein FRC11_009030 [Ceratobasidium sp. 423]|nr:hypothetical protein FRC11_009030 [Ceratobasidium sp. 423]